MSPSQGRTLLVAARGLKGARTTTILLPGSSGAVGRHLAAPLDRARWRRRPFDRVAFPGRPAPADEVVEGALEDEAALFAALRAAGAVVHLAGPSTPGYTWPDHQRVNADGTRRVLEAAVAGDGALGERGRR